MRAMVLATTALGLMASSCGTRNARPEITGETMNKLEGEKQVNVFLASSPNQNSPRRDFLGGANWEAEVEKNGLVQFTAAFPARQVPEEECAFVVLKGWKGDRVAQEMARAWNEQTKVACAAKADGANVKFYGDECAGNENPKVTSVCLGGGGLPSTPFPSQQKLDICGVKVGP